MLRRLFPTTVVLVLGFLPGCLFNSKSDTIVEPDAPRQAVTFESDAGMHRFHDAVQRRYHSEKVESSSEFAIPFLLDVESRRITSENAYWNAQVKKADIDQNGIISDAESHTYNGCCSGTH